MTLRHVLMTAAGLAIVAYGLVWWNHSRQAQASAQQQIQSVTAHGEGLAHVDQAQTSDTKAEQQTKALQDAQSEVDRLKAKLARALRQSASAGKPASDPVVSNSVPASDVQPVVDVDLRDQIIQAQDTQIQGIKAQVITLTASRDHWKAAYEAEARAGSARQMALEAQVSATKSARWMGRFEGFAVGASLGYVGGKL